MGKHNQPQPWTDDAHRVISEDLGIRVRSPDSSSGPLEHRVTFLLAVTKSTEQRVCLGMREDVLHHAGKQEREEADRISPTVRKQGDSDVAQLFLLYSQPRTQATQWSS